MPLTPLSPPPPKPYEAERDPVVWLVGVIAVVVAVLTLNQTAGIFGLSGAGRLVGSTVGAFTIVFLIGLIGAKIGGQSRTLARLGFVAGVLIVLGGLYIGERRIRNRDKPPLDDVASRNRLPVNRNSSADEKILLDEVQKLFAEALARRDGYQKDLQRVIGDGLAHASRLDTAPEIAEARTKLKRVREILAEVERDAAATTEALPTRIDALPIDEQLKRDTVNSYRQAVGQSLALSQDISRVSRESVDEVQRLVDFMEARIGQFRVDGNSPIFKTPEDVAAYNRIVRRLQELTAEEQALLRRQDKSTRENLEALKQMVKDNP